MRILVDYRPALRERTGVGEYAHELLRALQALGTSDELVLWTSSLRDRPVPSLRQELGSVQVVDRRIPVRALAWSWNRWQWPPVEWLAGRCDVVHSQSPLLIPASGAAQVVTIHDLDFLEHPERGQGQVRRDFPALAGSHARRADAVIVSSRYGAAEVVQRLGVDADRVHCCPPGPPPWAEAVRRQRGERPGTHVLFLGSLHPRKNVGALLDAYEALRTRVPTAPGLVLAGPQAPDAQAWIAKAQRPPLAPHVHLKGYVAAEERQTLLREARMLVLPSLDEGFGLPVLEAMACGVPVVVSNRGSLPEVAGHAANPVAPSDVEALAEQMRLLLDDEAARSASRRGLAQAARFNWAESARAALAAYRAAYQRRHAHRR